VENQIHRDTLAVLTVDYDVQQLTSCAHGEGTFSAWVLISIAADVGADR
jgi:hypothetical protein